MSDTEKIEASPQKEEVKEEIKSEMIDEKTKENEKKEEAMETEIEKEKEVKQEIKMEEDAKEEQKDENKPESQTQSVDTTPKKSPKKRKKVEKREDEEEEELPLGLLERPVVIESGKREKRKVERLSMTTNLKPDKKKQLNVPVGTGAKLGDCARIEYIITHRKTDDLVALHTILFGKRAKPTLVKRNLRQFCGFSFIKDGPQYKGKLMTIGKLTVPALNIICEVLDLGKIGHKEEKVQRVMDFLMSPVDSGKEIPEPRKKGRIPKTVDKKPTGIKRKRKEKKGERKKKKQTSKEDVESDGADNDDDDESDGLEENEKDDDVNEDGEMDGDEDESEEEAPKKKKAKTETKKAKKDSSEKKEKNDKREKKERPAKKEKKEPKKKKVEVSSDDDDDDDDSSNETFASKKSGPPNNDELRDVVKKILDGANLELVTMKTVVKQVYAKYPEYDLSDKKEFIKNTVKQLIS